MKFVIIITILINFNCVEDCSGQYNKLIINKSKCIDECKNDDIYKYEYNNNCYKDCPNNTIQCENNFTCIDKPGNKNEYLNKIIEEIVPDNINNSNKEIQDQVLEKIRDIFNNGFDTTDIDKGIDFTYNIKNINYTITTTLNEKNNEDKDKSSINLGECENKLKEQYNISQNDSLYLFKIDVLIDNVFKVEYEVYYNFTSNNFTKYLFISL